MEDWSNYYMYAALSLPRLYLGIFRCIHLFSSIFVLVGFAHSQNPVLF